MDKRAGNAPSVESLKVGIGNEAAQALTDDEIGKVNGGVDNDVPVNLVCPVCHKSFATNVDYMSHMRTHPLQSAKVG